MHLGRNGEAYFPEEGADVAAAAEGAQAADGVDAAAEAAEAAEAAAAEAEAEEAMFAQDLEGGEDATAEQQTLVRRARGCDARAHSAPMCSHAWPTLSTRAVGWMR